MATMATMATVSIMQQGLKYVNVLNAIHVGYTMIQFPSQ